MLNNMNKLSLSDLGANGSTSSHNFDLRPEMRLLRHANGPDESIQVASVWKERYPLVMTNIAIENRHL